MITGSLQKKKGLYYAVLNLYDDYGKRKPKWIPTGYTIKGNKKKAERCDESADGDAYDSFIIGKYGIGGLERRTERGRGTAGRGI